MAKAAIGIRKEPFYSIGHRHLYLLPQICKMESLVILPNSWMS